MTLPLSNTRKLSIFSLLLATLLFSQPAFSASYSESLRLKNMSMTPPPLAREFRGVWVTTVFNVDWPSRKGLPVAQQKAELLALLDRAADMHMNAVIFQVRTECDAFYASPFEPWSDFLTGKMGQAPSPYYDPLTFAVAEAHKRGLELHAWINPFRALVSTKKTVSPNHVSKKIPGIVRQHGNFLWIDPAEKTSLDYTLRIAQDIVRRYDIDGLQIDDYFYPPTQPGPNGKALDFDDNITWKRYQASGGKLSRSDWRRENINNCVKRLYETVKREKSWVKFGISPPGIWRPHYPKQIVGRDVYEAIYADTRKWLVNGWCDYFAPQLYWPIDKKEQSFPVLLKWWNEQNTQHRSLWPGLATGDVGGSWKPSEIINQIQIARNQPGVNGHLHYHMATLKKNPKGLSDQLTKLYAEPAVVPAMPWISKAQPEKPVVTARRERGELKVSWREGSRNQIRWWIVQKLVAGRWATEILPAEQTAYTIKSSEATPVAFAVSGMNRYGSVSSPSVYQTSTLASTKR